MPYHKPLKTLQMASEAGRNRNVRQRDGQPDEMISLTSHIFPATDDDDGPSRQCVNSKHAADSARLEWVKKMNEMFKLECAAPHTQQEETGAVRWDE